MMELSQIISLTLGGIGTALGIFNAWQSYSDKHVRLRIEIGSWLQLRNSCVLTNTTNKREKDNFHIYISVINIGQVDATISSVGFMCKGGGTIAYLNDSRDTMSDKLPHSLPPRKKLSFYIPSEIVTAPQFCNAISVYARTECGKDFIAGKQKIEEIHSMITSN